MNRAASQTRHLGIASVLLDPQKRHRIWISLGALLGIALTIALTANGWDYYVLDQAHRPLAAKHDMLKPSGTIGLRLGILGLVIFLLIYLYPLRKRWPTLQRIGKTKNWLDFHIMLGLIAPVVISFHSSFKIHGFAGMAYWTMMGLTASGVIGRYFYAQIPRSIGAAEMSWNEMSSLSSQLVEELHAQRVIPASKMESIFRLPDSQEVQAMSLWRALLRMLWLDLTRPLKVWALRRSVEGRFETVFTLGGIFPTRHRELEAAIALASKQAALAKRVLFLSKTQAVFHLWHVIHVPFSLSFAIFVIIHVTVVIWLGYF
jgi:hypothetical protein